MSKDLLKTEGIILAVIGAALAVTYFTTEFLVRLAINREIPRTPVKKASGRSVSGKNKSSDMKISEYENELEKASVKLAESTSEEIQITAYDGVTLVGHYITCNNPKRILIAMHGWRSSWHRDFGIVADTWKEKGCSVLYAEQRAQNNSGGKYIGFGLTERYDCANWAKWAAERFGPDLPIYLVGVSMGASTVLYASELDLPKEVHGIIADCGFTSPDEIFKHVAKENLHIAYHLRSIVADELFQRRTKEPNDKYSTEDALRKTDVPVLFIHGTDDHFVPISMMFQNYAACASEKDFLIVQGADHGMSYFVDKTEYEKVVLNFWDRYDHYERPSKVKENTVEDNPADQV